MVIQNNYLTGNEILCKLNKKYILSEIKEYIEQTTEYEILFEEHNAAIEQTLNFEYSIIDKIEEIEIENESEVSITAKVNRQSKVKTRGKRQIVRKGE